jgi:hypothetical protein
LARTTTFVQLENPRGIDVAADGTVYAVDAKAKRVLHLTAAGAQSGRIRRIAADGTATTVSR